ncbi:MAG: MFS transporter [Nocardioides sp.]
MSETLLTRPFVMLALSDLAYFTAAGVLLLATPLFASGPLGADPAGVGLAMGSFSVTTLLLRPWIGRWTDRHGRRTLLVGGAAAFAVVVLGHLVVTGLVGLVVVRLLLGAAETCYFVAGFAALADLAPPARAGEALSLNSLALYAGIGVGPLLGQGMLSVGGYTAAWWAAAALAAGATGLALAVPETHGAAAADAPDTPLVNRSVLLPGAVLGAGVLAMSGFMAFSVLLAKEVDARPWSLALLLFGTTVVVCRTVFARLPDRVEPVRMTTLALLASAAGMLLIGSVPSAAGLLVGAVVCGVGSAFVTPAVFAMVFRVVPEAERGSAAASVSLFLDLGLSGGPMLLGAIAAVTDLPWAFALVGLVPAAGAVTLTAVRPGRRTAAV